MKKLTYLYILLLTSILSTVGKIYTTFFSQPDSLDINKTGDVMVDRLIEEAQIVREKQFEINTNIINKTLIILMAILLVLIVIYTFKSELKAISMYIIYLGVAMVYHIYAFVNSKVIVDLYSNTDQKRLVSTSTKYSFIFSSLIFVIYLIIIFINYKRNQQERDPKKTIGIDI